MNETKCINTIKTNYKKTSNPKIYREIEKGIMGYIPKYFPGLGPITSTTPGTNWAIVGTCSAKIPISPSVVDKLTWVTSSAL